MKRVEVVCLQIKWWENQAVITERGHKAACGGWLLHFVETNPNSRHYATSKFAHRPRMVQADVGLSPKVGHCIWGVSFQSHSNINSCLDTAGYVTSY